MVEVVETSKLFKDNKEKMHQFIPKEFNFLTKSKKIEYKGINLKTDYLINIINEVIMKYLITSDITFNLWSMILRKKYGKNYSKYFSWLVEKEFIFLVSNYYVGTKAKTYKINTKYLKNIKRVFIEDKILLKKYSKEFLNQSFLYFTKSPIDFEIRKKLVDDLYHVNIDYEKASKFLNDNKEKLNNVQYIKNCSSIDSIKTGYIFFKFDEYGRIHTNFTILKKEIRKNFLTIDGEEIKEIDIKNSQPLFLSKLLIQEIGKENFNKECYRFIDLVKNGLVYDELVEKIELENRDEAKKLMYKVLFGNNNEKNKWNKKFKEIFPTIYSYIKEIKSINKSYKEMSHFLQKMESDFIFNKVVRKINEKLPEVKLFTVHDSICFPKKYEAEISLIFSNYLKKEMNF